MSRVSRQGAAVCLSAEFSFGLVPLPTLCPVFVPREHNKNVMSLSSVTLCGQQDRGRNMAVPWPGPGLGLKVPSAASWCPPAPGTFIVCHFCQPTLFSVFSLQSSSVPLFYCFSRVIISTLTFRLFVFQPRDSERDPCLWQSFSDSPDRT